MSRAERRIVVCDDDRSTREGLAAFLTSEGYDVDVAEDGLAALDRCQRRAPDLLLTDLDMPRMRGEELIDRIRAIRPDLEIAVITGEHPYDAGRRAASLGVRSYFIKPIDLDELLRRIDELLDDA